MASVRGAENSKLSAQVRAMSSNFFLPIVYLIDICSTTFSCCPIHSLNGFANCLSCVLTSSDSYLPQFRTV